MNRYRAPGFQELFRFTITTAIVFSSVATIHIPKASAAEEPAVMWETKPDLTFSGVTQIQATAVSTSGYIKKFCVVKDGSPINTNIGSGRDLNTLGTFSPSTGCWTSDFDSFAYSLSSGKLQFDTTTWADSSYSYQVTVTDSSGRVGVSPVLKINTYNPRPNVALEGITPGEVIAGIVDFSINAQVPKELPGLLVTSYCLTFQGNTKCQDFRLFSLDTTLLKNGTHYVTISVVDSANRTTLIPDIPLISDNPKASLNSVKPVIFRNWSARDKRTKLFLVLAASDATRVKIKYGTSLRSLKRTKWISVQGGVITGLRSKTNYYFSAQAFGVNGNSKLVKFSARTR